MKRAWLNLTCDVCGKEKKTKLTVDQGMFYPPRENFFSKIGWKSNWYAGGKDICSACLADAGKAGRQKNDSD